MNEYIFASPTHFEIGSGVSNFNNLAYATQIVMVLIFSLFLVYVFTGGRKLSESLVSIIARQ